MSKIPLTVRFIPRYEVTSSRREVTQKASVELEVAESMSMSDSVEVEFMVELEYGSVLNISKLSTEMVREITHVFKQTSSRTRGYMPTMSWISEPERLNWSRSEAQAEEKFWAVESNRS